MSKAQQKRHHAQNHFDSKHGCDSSLKLTKVTPLTEGQQETMDSWKQSFNLLLCGSAGTGKTYLSVYLALKDVLNQTTPYQKVILVRSTVASRDIGFLPGKVQDKLAPFEAPYTSMINELFGRGDAFEILKQKGIFQVVPTSFLRGMTFNNSIIICDEIQNFNYEELSTTITRCGSDTRFIAVGDSRQDDLHRNRYDVSGMNRFLNVIDRMDAFEIIEFVADDIVRSGLVKEWILAELAYEEEEFQQRLPNRGNCVPISQVAQ